MLPGLSAVQAVAARAGAPLGGDFAVLCLSDRLKPWAVIEQRLRAVAEADLVLAIYNPASRSRTEQVAAAQELLLEHRPADTVVVVGRDVGRAEESLAVTTLADLDPEAIDMRCLLIVGSTGDASYGPGRVWTPRSSRVGRARTVVEVRLAAGSSGSSARPTRITAAWRSPAASTWSAMSATVPRSTSCSGWLARCTTTTGQSAP